MDKINTEILERLCNGDSHARIAREMNIPINWIQEAINEFNREVHDVGMNMFGGDVERSYQGMN